MFLGTFSNDTLLDLDPNPCLQYGPIQKLLTLQVDSLSLSLTLQKHHKNEIDQLTLASDPKQTCMHRRSQYIYMISKQQQQRRAFTYAATTHTNTHTLARRRRRRICARIHNETTHTTPL